MSIRSALLAALISASLLTACNRPQPINEEESASLIQPVARVTLAAAGDGTPKGSRTGEQVVSAVCSTCHGSGALDSPKIGDEAQWRPRIAQGLDGLLKSALAGKNQMPARGGNAELTDEEVARAVVYMANKSGASFKEPPVKAAAK